MNWIKGPLSSVARSAVSGGGGGNGGNGGPDRLSEILAEQKRTNELLEQLIGQLEGARLAPTTPGDLDQRIGEVVASVFAAKQQR